MDTNKRSGFYVIISAVFHKIFDRLSSQRTFLDFVKNDCRLTRAKCNVILLLQFEKNGIQIREIVPQGMCVGSDLVEVDKNLNVIIGANGQLKTSLIDAIRLFYAWGEPNRDIEITKEDFYVEVTSNVDGSTTVTPSAKIDICYLFEGLSAQQEGAFYQYLDRKDDGNMVARVHLCFEMKEKGRIVSSYITGNEENGLRADWDTFHYFHPYYLGALRDSTRDLMSTRNNLLGRVIKRKI